MRTFERRKANVLWIWDIDLAGRHLTILHGKRGQRMQVLRLELDDAARAEKECHKRIRDKVREGYVEKPAAGVQPSSVREALEMALAAQPDDLGTHMAYADHLHEQGDPRGELIQMQLALEGSSTSTNERQRLQKREQELIAAHWREWLGELGTEIWREETQPPPGLHFARGWLDTLVIPTLTVALARALVRAPQVRLLRRLQIYTCKGERTGSKPEAEDLPRYELYPANYVLARSALLGNLRALHIGGPLIHSPSSRYPRSGMALHELLPRLFRLEELSLSADGFTSELFTVPFPPTLRVLHLNGGYINDEALSLAKSGLLEQLKVLRLWNGSLNDVGAGNLARRLPQSQLELLDLSYNHLTYAGIETLRATGAHLIAQEQTEPRGSDDDEDDEL